MRRNGGLFEIPFPKGSVCFYPGNVYSLRTGKWHSRNRCFTHASWWFSIVIPKFPRHWATRGSENYSKRFPRRSWNERNKNRGYKSTAPFFFLFLFLFFLSLLLSLPLSLFLFLFISPFSRSLPLPLVLPLPLSSYALSLLFLFFLFLFLHNFKDLRCKRYAMNMLNPPRYKYYEYYKHYQKKMCFVFTGCQS